jgi:hypothetical protein
MASSTRQGDGNGIWGEASICHGRRPPGASWSTSAHRPTALVRSGPIPSRPFWSRPQRERRQQLTFPLPSMYCRFGGFIGGLSRTEHHKDGRPQPGTFLGTPHTIHRFIPDFVRFSCFCRDTVKTKKAPHLQGYCWSEREDLNLRPLVSQ